MNDFVFQCAYLHYWPYVIVCLAGALWWKFKRAIMTSYSYSSLLLFQDRCSHALPFHKKIIYLMRFILLLLLGFLLLKPQLVDHQSQILIDGIDMVIALDISGSMQFQDYDDDPRSRVDVAKDEAARFITLRKNDAIGLVIFGNEALSRCPITSDKQMLKSLIMDLKIGIIDPDGTVLARAILAGCNRLKNSPSKTKILILLTDGEPSQNDLSIEQAIDVAQKLKIKIYTIGIGSDKDSYFMDPFFGLRPKPKVNAALLGSIAKMTGGEFFMARSRSDMRLIYDRIDSLEKTAHEIPLFSRYFPLIHPYGIYAFIILVIEIFLTTWVWVWL